MAHPYLRRRRERQNRSAFAALIATPAVGSFAMPANGKLRFVATAGATAGELAATLVGAYRNAGTGVAEDREIRTPELASGGSVRVDYIERAVTVTVEAGFEVELDIGQGRWAKIGGIGVPIDFSRSDIDFSRDDITFSSL